MKKLITILLFLSALSTTAQVLVKDGQIVNKDTDAQALVRDGDSLRLSNSPPVFAPIVSPSNPTASEIAYANTPTNYTPTASDVAGHFAGVDAALGLNSGGGSFDPDADLTSNDADWNFNRLGGSFFRITPSANHVSINAVLRIGNGGLINGSRVSHYFSSSFDITEYAIRKASGNDGNYISGGKTSAVNDAFVIENDGSFNITGTGDFKKGGVAISGGGSSSLHPPQKNLTANYDVTAQDFADKTAFYYDGTANITITVDDVAQLGESISIEMYNTGKVTVVFTGGVLGDSKTTIDQDNPMVVKRLNFTAAKFKIYNGE